MRRLLPLLALISTPAYGLMVIGLPCSSESSERDWSAALAADIGGVTEASFECDGLRGRVDVLTASEAVEVDWQSKWKLGLGQALWYADVTGNRPVLALIAKEPIDWTEVDAINAWAESHGAEVWLLVEAE